MPAIAAGNAAPGYTVAVRSLCDFAARRGDLSTRFTPAPTAQQGLAGHLIVGARRGPNYQREITLVGRHGSLMVRGRADGYDEGHHRLEEFKTHRGDLARMPANQRLLHWAQLKVYGAMLCAQRCLPDIELALIYFNIGSEKETALQERWSAPQLQAYFESLCEPFLRWALREVAHRERRDGFLAKLKFPHAELRSGQRHMAEAVYKAAMRDRCLMVQAPTGIGKTVGTVFPLLKAVPVRKLDKVFFLVAKTSGRALALDALAAIGATGEPALRVLELVSKQDACVYPGRSCDGESCPLAKGFYDRLAQARHVAAERGTLNQETVREVAAQTNVCPYYLAQEMVRWSDVVIGDYNYFFDTSAILHGLSLQNQWRIGLLVDEAHNLLNRGRDMYSAVLKPTALAAAKLEALPPARMRLLQVERAWGALHELRDNDYLVHAAIPLAFTATLREAIVAIADQVAESTESTDSLLTFWFEALHFCRMADAFGEHSLFDVTRAGSDATLCIRNINPGPFLAPRIAACATAVCSRPP